MKAISEKFKTLIQDEKSRRIIRISFLIVLLFLIISILASKITVKENKEYGDFRHIVAYIYEYNELPKNYIPKSLSFTIEGEDLYLYEIFNNNEGLLPTEAIYISAYLNSTKTYVSPERIVFSAKEVYYTDDHYESFDLVTRFDIYGFHYITLSLFFLMFTGGGLLIWISIRNGYITTQIIKTDIKQDINAVIGAIKSSFENVKKYLSSKKR